MASRRFSRSGKISAVAEKDERHKLKKQTGERSTVPPHQKAYILVVVVFFIAACINPVKRFRRERDAIAAWFWGIVGAGGALVLARFVYVAWG
ncbi:disulfide bond formation protein B [Ensifer adhaerens]|uniref:disulfide bond formation protein B n=1 Tax=Ensifer adhaerens TaxID=106592 RepID=UPI001178734C|nr:disulfide bond formation protein B [Ensifer adhaerens]